MFMCGSCGKEIKVGGNKEFIVDNLKLYCDVDCYSKRDSFALTRREAPKKKNRKVRGRSW